MNLRQLLLDHDAEAGGAGERSGRAEGGVQATAGGEEEQGQEIKIEGPRSQTEGLKKPNASTRGGWPSNGDSISDNIMVHHTNNK